MKRTFRLLPLLVALFWSCQETTLRVHHYDPAEVYPGRTMTLLASTGHFLVFDFDGNVQWEYVDSLAGGICDFEVLEDTNILYMRLGGRPTILAYPDQTIYEGPTLAAHHSISELPWGNLLYVTGEGLETDGWMGRIHSNTIEELDPVTGEVVWVWKSDEHIDPYACYCPFCINTQWKDGRDWTHGNTVHFYEDKSAILYNPRNLDTLYMISYPDGEILWACGRCGTFGEGLFYHPHDPYILPNGNILMFDNGNHRQPNEWSRALEIAVNPAEQEAYAIWEYRETPDFYAPTMCDANRLPNGNTLITDAWRGRILEVNPASEKVWEVTIVNQSMLNTPYMMYKAERIPSDLWDCWDIDRDSFRDVACGGNDCDDSNAGVNPGVTEEVYGDPICEDGLDNDCDGLTDTEDDGCQACTSPADCDDGNSCTDDECVDFACTHSDNMNACDDGNPCTTGDVCSQGTCSGLPFEFDGDGDGYVSDLCGGDDCDDADPDVNPGEPEGPPGDSTCTDGSDNDCDEHTDGLDADCAPLPLQGTA